MRRLALTAALLTALAVVPSGGEVAPGGGAGGPGSLAGALPPPPGTMASGNVEHIFQIPEPGAFGGAIVGDLMYVTTTQGLRIFDISDPSGLPVPVGALVLPHFGNENVSTNGEILLIATDHLLGSPSRLYVIDVSNPTLPLLLSIFTPDARAHTATCILDCQYAWIAGSEYISVVDLRDPANPATAGRFYRNGTSSQAGGHFGLAHDVEVDEAGIAWVSALAGFFAYDPSLDPVQPRVVAALPNGQPDSFVNNFIVHNSMRPNAAQATPAKMADGTIDPGEVLLVTEENWLTAQNGQCARDGAFQTGWFRIDNGVKVIERLDAINLGRMQGREGQKDQPILTCSAHYFDYRDDGVVAISWYEQGIRFLDVSDPREIREIGYFVTPDTSAVATRWRDAQILYTFDLVRGIDVLRFTGGAGDPAIEPPPLRPAQVNLFQPVPGFGYACRVPGV